MPERVFLGGHCAHYQALHRHHSGCAQELSPDQMNKLPVSVCMISGAEAHRIGRALESVADWTSEIVVVLNEEVNDGTAEIVQRYGGIIHRYKWQGFREQKNL